MKYLVGYIWDDVFKQNIEIIFPANNEIYHYHLLQKFKIDDSIDDDWAGRCMEIYSGGTVVTMILLKKMSRNSYEFFCVLSHECFHATHYILDRKGIKLSKKTGELFAHYQEYLFRNCLYLLSKKGDFKIFDTKD